MDLKIYTLIKKPATVTQQLQKSIDFCRIELYDFHLCIKMAWNGIFKGLSQDGGRKDFSKKFSAILPLIKIYRMSLISAWSVSLDSTFNGIFPLLTF